MGIKDSVEKSVKQTLLKKVIDTIYKNPEENVDKIFELIKKMTKDKKQINQIDFVYNYYKTQPATYELIQNILKGTDKKCLEKFIANFFAKANWFAASKRAKYMETEDTKIPFVLLIRPSMQCNLRCKGCYAVDMLNQPKMPIEEVEGNEKDTDDRRGKGVYKKVFCLVFL